MKPNILHIEYLRATFNLVKGSAGFSGIYRRWMVIYDKKGDEASQSINRVNGVSDMWRPA
jgi:hypothetical protein